MSEAFEEFQRLLEESNHYRRILTLMGWDMYTATPRQGYDDMAKTYTYFSGKQFALNVSPKMGRLLETLSQPEELERLSEGMRYTVKLMRREYARQSRIPADFQSAFTAASSASQKAWETAKRTNDFALFAPHLKNMIRMTKEKVSFTDPGKDVYEVLVNEYEEGMDTAALDRAFDQLKEGLLPLLEELEKRPKKRSRIREGSYPVWAQRKVQRLLLEYIGFRFDAGAVAESEHPFTTGFSRWDVRLTNHFHEKDPLSAMFSAIHEGGHGIFEQNVDPALKDTAADDCRYMGIHESQSRFFENILGRRKAFWVPIYPQIQKILPDLQDITLDEFMEEVNSVRPSLIRCDADEVTYCLHIILRYEMERLIFSQDIPVEELPRLWNEKTQEYLHLTPPSDSEGILQDMHWSDASFGYFPSYLLGSIYDGMFLEQMETELGSVDDLLEAGNIQVIREWLSTHIHRFGSLRTPAQVLDMVCRRPLDSQPLLTYFRRKYLG